jgi:hypothetical protein
MISETLSIATFLVVILIALVIWLYQRRQARALDHVDDSVHLAVEMMVKDRRENRRKVIGELEAQAWTTEQLALLTQQDVLRFVRVERILPDVQALELIADDNRRVIVSPLDLAALISRTTSKGKVRGKDAAARLTNFAERPLLGKRPKQVRSLRMTLLENEWLDMEANALGVRYGLAWGAPERLWFHIVAQAE